MKQKHLVNIVAQLLEKAGQEFSNHSCTDDPEDFYGDMSRAEISDLYKEYHVWNGDLNTFDPDHLGYLREDTLMTFFSDYILLNNILPPGDPDVKIPEAMPSPVTRVFPTDSDMGKAKNYLIERFGPDFEVYIRIHLESKFILALVKEFEKISVENKNAATKVFPLHPEMGDKEVLPELIKDFKAREQIGIKKYGTKLKIFNGRIALVDAFQEACDLVMYLKQALMEAEEKKK